MMESNLAHDHPLALGVILAADLGEVELRASIAIIIPDTTVMVAQISGWLQASNQDLSGTPDRVLGHRGWLWGASEGACCIAVDKPQPSVPVVADCRIPVSGPAAMPSRPVFCMRPGSVTGLTIFICVDPSLQLCPRIASLNVLGTLAGC